MMLLVDTAIAPFNKHCIWKASSDFIRQNKLIYANTYFPDSKFFLMH